MHQQCLAECWPAARFALKVDRRGHVHEWQTNKLSEAASDFLQCPCAHNVFCTTVRVLDRTKHDGDVGAQACLVSNLMALQPFLGIDLVRAQNGTNIVVKNFGGGARQ